MTRVEHVKCGQTSYGVATSIDVQDRLGTEIQLLLSVLPR